METDSWVWSWCNDARRCRARREVQINKCTELWSLVWRTLIACVDVTACRRHTTMVFITDFGSRQYRSPRVNFASRRVASTTNWQNVHNDIKIRSLHLQKNRKKNRFAVITTIFFLNCMGTAQYCLQHQDSCCIIGGYKWWLLPICGRYSLEKAQSHLAKKFDWLLCRRGISMQRQRKTV